jgi:hypothetical protein
MSQSWRPVRWRLVALLTFVTSLAATTTFAGQARPEQVRVKSASATVYERPRLSSEVVVTVQQGTVLEVLQREGDWYWVVLPADANGTRRTGYVTSSAVERVGDTRVPEPGIVGLPSQAAPPVSMTKAVTPEPPRFYVGVSAGWQFGVPDFSDHVDFTLYQAAGSFDARYANGSGNAFEATVGVRLAPQLVLAFALWRSTGSSTVSATASVPHPLNYNQPRTATASGLPVNREENDGHLQLTYVAPLSPRIELAVFGGPSVFYLRQDLINAFTYRDVYPYDTVAIEGYETTTKSKAVIGINIGADLTVMVWRFAGVGVGVRYARSSMNLPSAGEGSIPVDVGGTQVSAGVRLRF